jgi:antitoxin ParD1/3/4
MAFMNVSVPDPMRDWVEQRIAGSQYASVSDYARDLIHRDQAQADVHHTLVAALIAGENSGNSNRRIPEILAAVKAEIARTAECTRLHKAVVGWASAHHSNAAQTPQMSDLSHATA